MNELIRKIENQQIRKDLVNFGTGAYIDVALKIVENNKTRIQHFEGVVLRVRGTGLGKTFTVRKISAGIGVEKTIPINSPSIVNIRLVRENKVRRSRIYFMRKRFGKAMRLKEKRSVNTSK